MAPRSLFARATRPLSPVATTLALSGLMAASIVGVSPEAAAQPALINGLGGAADYGASCLGPNDDGSSREIDLSSIFPTGLQFFDQTHTSMFVNTNGNISFSGDVAEYTPESFPVANQPMIAPFWADVDLRTTTGGSSNCVGRDGGSGYGGDCENPADNGVWWHLDVPNRRVIVTWDNVGYYDCSTDKIMNFQLILTAAGEGSACGAGGADFDVEFRYNNCQWNTGRASGGTDGLASEPVRCIGSFCPILLGGSDCDGGYCHGPLNAAQAGFDAGNSTDFVEIAGSRTHNIHRILCDTSNVDEAGIWRYQIRSGAVICPGAGDACETGTPGVCAAGRNQCVADGIECRPEVGASAERCDALDNDCNGQVDEGEGICGDGAVCDRGVCVAGCFEGGCGAGQTCTAAGVCVDTGCEDVTCDAGQRCVAGACASACDGVVCPAGTDCRGGRCVDLCAGATCDDCTVCEEGTCVARCDQGGSCASGQTCAADGSCVENACATVTCAAGEVCEAGSCVDACAGAVCPSGESCELGACVAAMSMQVDAGVQPGVDAGPIAPGTDAGQTNGSDAAIGMADGGDAGGSDPGGTSSPGCACRVDRGHAPMSQGGALGLLGLLGLLWRRRR